MSLKIFNDHNEIIYMTRDRQLISQILKIDMEGGRPVLDSESGSSSEEPDSDDQNIATTDECVSGIALETDATADMCGCRICPKHDNEMFEDMFEWLEARQQDNDDEEISIEKIEKKKDKKKRKLVL